METFDRNLIEKKFSNFNVALGLKFVNETGESTLEHVDTFLQSGTLDSYYTIPSTIGRSPSSEVFVVKNPVGLSGGLWGTAGLSLWKIIQQPSDNSSPIKIESYLVVSWSCPRNFFLHENTIGVSLIKGPPRTQTLQELFHIIMDPATPTQNTFFDRANCPFNSTMNACVYANNKFVVSAQIGGQHKDLAIIKLHDAPDSSLHFAEMSSNGIVNLDPYALVAKPARWTVKCLVHNHEVDNSITDRETLYDYHIGLMFERENEDPWICELGSRGVNNDISNFYEAKEEILVLKSISKSKLATSRNRLGLVAFNLGKVDLELSDIVYWSDRIFLQKSVANDRPICQEWLKSLAAKLNLPNQGVLDLLTLGDNGWLGLDWLGSVTDLLRSQVNEISLDEKSVNLQFDVDEKTGPKVRFGGFEKLREFRCAL